MEHLVGHARGEIGIAGRQQVRPAVALPALADDVAQIFELRVEVVEERELGPGIAWAKSRRPTSSRRSSVRGRTSDSREGPAIRMGTATLVYTSIAAKSAQ